MTATTALAVTDAGQNSTVSVSGLFTMKSANDIASYFQTTKTDGIVDIYLNNDSNVYWNFKLSGTGSDSLYLETASGAQTGALPILSIAPAGHIGIGTRTIDATTVLNVLANDASSASFKLNNATDNVVVKMNAQASSGNIGTVTNSPFGIKVNDTDAITIAANGDVTIAGLLGQSDGHAIYDDGVLLTDRLKLDFQGAAVRAYDDGVDTTVVSVSASNAIIPFTTSADTEQNIVLQSAAIGDSVSSDPTPILGGHLITNDFAISSETNKNITIAPHGTGKIIQTSVTANSLSAGTLSANFIPMYADMPLKIGATAGTTWTIGWWQSSNGQWWLLGNTTDASTFTRSDAEFYIPTGDILDVPTS
ncbi:MAG: hypothetical protein O3C19_01950 [Bacteroidetes bacterium]|nr:hypothetical protein [Bacteroidota bacterium]